MPDTDIKPGTRFTIHLKSKEETEPDFAVSTTLDSQLGESDLLIYAPIVKGHIFPITIGEELMVVYFEQNLKHSFRAIVRERLIREDFQFLRIERFTEIVRTQRRDDFRLNHSVPVKIQYKIMQLGKPKRVTISGSSVDVSGGGISIRLSQRLYEGDTIYVEFELYDLTLKFTAKVMWFADIKDNPVYKYFCGCRFQHNSLLEKDSLVRLIFKVQQEQIKLMDR